MKQYKYKVNEAEYDVTIKSIVGNLTVEIAERSIYDYLEQELGIIVAMGKRTITVERVEKRRVLFLHRPHHNRGGVGLSIENRFPRQFEIAHAVAFFIAVKGVAPTPAA